MKRLIYPTAHINEDKLLAHFSKKTVVIVGASQGIGAALAIRLMPTHCRLILIARTENKLKALCDRAQQEGCTACYYALDLRDREALSKLTAQLSHEVDAVDYLFYNAGKSINRYICKATDRLHDYDRTIDVNYRAMVALALELHGKLTAAKGMLVYTSSVSTLFPAAPGWSAYHASKTAANVWCETANAEWAKMGICVKIAYMPLVHTSMSDVNKTYRRMPAYSKEEAADQLLRLSMCHRDRYIPWWARIAAPLAALFTPIIKIIYKRIA